MNGSIPRDRYRVLNADAPQHGPSPVPLLGLLLQARQQGVEAVVVAVQQALGQLAEVGVVLLVQQGEGQVTAAADVLQDEGQHVLLHHALELGHQPRQQLHPDLVWGEAKAVHTVEPPR